MAWRMVLVALSTLVLSTGAFYIPLRAPTNFCTLEQAQNLHGNASCTTHVSVYVNNLGSVKVLIPYEYSSFDFCLPDEETTKDRDPPENIGQILIGERLRKSACDININFAENITVGRELCTKTYEKGNKDHKAKLEFLRERIHESYMHQWVIDNMPVTWCYSIMESDQPYCTTRFPIGCFVTPEGIRHDACYLSNFLKEPGATYIFNHVHLFISYHKGSKQNKFQDGRIVRAQVQLGSCNKFPCSPKSAPLKLPKPKDTEEGKPFKLTYTYTVEFLEMENIRWSSRWDYILTSVPSSYIQYFNLFFSCIIVLFLSLVLWVIICRSSQGIIQDNDAMDSEESFGWKLVRERPRAAMLLSACVGSGLQILCTTFSVLLFACLGILSPPNRGALMTAILVFYALFGCVAGYLSARIYKMIGGMYWKTNVLMTVFFVPGITFCVFLILNLLLLRAGSSAAIPSTTLLTLLCLWCGVSLPLTVVGSFFGFRKPVPEQQVKKSYLSKEIRYVNRSDYLIMIVTCLMRGIPPFFCSFIQFFFIYGSLWSGQIYYMFGTVMLAFLLLVLACGITASAHTLYCLRHGDYRWWWRSFFSTACATFYLFLYSIHYFVYKTSITGALSYALYFGYTFIMVFLYFILTGTIGFLASLVFVYKIYFELIPTKPPVSYIQSDQDQVVILPEQKCNSVQESV